MGKIKRILLTIALLAIVVTFTAQGSLAYYTTIGQATNVVTSGNIRFIIHETTDSGEEFPQQGVTVLPGAVVSKQVSIENDCEHPFYLRVKIVYSANGEALPAEDCFKLDIDTQHWLLKDGWYYYNGVVEPGQTTPYLFTKAEVVGDTVNNRYIGKTLNLSVVAHAVQSENNPIAGEDVTTAAGWPQE